ncbi:MAG: hypothetical protein ACP5OJ_00970 [Methanothermobacter sp.]
MKVEKYTPSLVTYLIENKTAAIILAVLTFIIGSISLVIVIFYFFRYPLSSIGEHQLYVFFAILVGALLASMVYGRGSKERASTVVKILNDSMGIKIEEGNMYRILRIIEQISPFIVEKYIFLKINAVEEFEDKIKGYKTTLTEEDLLNIKKIVETPITELQSLLDELYKETNMEQFKLMSQPQAKPLIELNLRELKKIWFEE